jgi:hypothetical protein
MARVWLYKYGTAPTSTPPLAEKPLAECVKHLRLVKTAWIAAVSAKTLLGSSDDAIATKNIQHIVVLVGDAEASASGWKAGYYFAPVSLKDACTRLGVKLPAT